MDRSLLVGLWAACLAAGLAACGGGEPRPASVVLLVADDLGRGDLGVLGLGPDVTPRLDRLAAEGLVAHRAYTPSALCRPSRASLMTGCYPHNTGRSWYGEMREDLEQWPDRFRRARFVTGVIGKTAVEEKRERWDFSEGGRIGYEKGRSPEYYSGLTADFLDLAADRPFALVVDFFDPHCPSDRVALQRLQQRATEEQLRDVRPPPNLPSTGVLRQEQYRYREDVRRLDRSVGAVLDELERRGRAADTLVMFVSDNGADLPFAKATLYEAGINMPLLVRWPGRVAPGSATQALVSFVDLLPTALEAAGLTPPGGIDGRSLVGLLEGRVAAHRDLVFGEQDESREGEAAPSRSVVDARYKYIRHFRLDTPFEVASMRTRTWESVVRAAADDPALAARIDRLRNRPREELFDLEADPWELVDLSADAAHRALLERLRAQLRDWMEREDDPLLAEWGS